MGKRQVLLFSSLFFYFFFRNRVALATIGTQEREYLLKTRKARISAASVERDEVRDNRVKAFLSKDSILVIISAFIILLVTPLTNLVLD